MSVTKSHNSRTWQTPFVDITQGELQVPVSRTLTLVGTTTGPAAIVNVRASGAVKGSGAMSGDVRTRKAMQLENQGVWIPPSTVTDGVTTACGMSDGAFSVLAGASLVVPDGCTLTLYADAQVAGRAVLEGSGQLAQVRARSSARPSARASRPVRAYTFSGSNVRLIFSAVTVTMYLKRSAGVAIKQPSALATSQAN